MSQGSCQGLRLLLVLAPWGDPVRHLGKKASDSDQRDGAGSSGGEAG